MIQDSGNKNKIKEFTDLIVWKESHKAVLSVYRLTEKFPRSEMFGLTSQMRRSAVSITSNIAEGFGRQTIKDKINFFYVAHGSLTELKNQIFISRDVGYITIKQSEELLDKLATSHALLLLHI
jgi:four helix bundle protein